MISELFISGISISPDIPKKQYYSSLVAIKSLMLHGKLELTKPVTFFVGENGIGKSTLTEAVAVAYGFNPEGGSRNFTFSTAQTHSDLCNYTKLTRGVAPLHDGYFLRAESFYNLATNLEELDGYPLGSTLIQSYGGVSLHSQSHGESFMSLIKNRFGGNGLYILDEPEAALSPSNQMALLLLINDLVKRNSQFIIATHSPILMAFPGAEIFYLTESGIESVSYRQTDHFNTTKDFLNNPEAMLKALFNGGEKTDV